MEIVSTEQIEGSADPVQWLVTWSDGTTQVQRGDADEQALILTRTEAVGTKARAIITRLKEIEAQAANRPDATNLAQANTQLQGLADAVSDLSRVLRHVVVLNVVPDLLTDDDASSDLDS